MHYKYAILIGISEPNYTQEELTKLKEKDIEEISFNGKNLTRYEASQLQRRIETAVRQKKDLAIIAKASGDDVFRRQIQGDINRLNNQYVALSKASGLPMKTERMSVSGFSRVRR